MASSESSQHSDTESPPLPPVKLDPLAALLSYLVPGLGQVYQGRVGKGLLFFFGLYLLFFYGMWMGQWRNVWLPDVENLPDVVIQGQKLQGTLKAIAYRPQFLGQFWIGAVAWPAVAQYATTEMPANSDEAPKPHRLLGRFMQTPNEGQLNDLQRNGSKRWDLGWVYTVIAGVLNLLVIYDALAGPMFREPLSFAKEEGTESHPLPLPPEPDPVAATVTAPAGASSGNPTQGGTL